MSCASMRLVSGPIGPSERAGEDQGDYEEPEGPLYTEEEYEELEGAFQN